MTSNFSSPVTILVGLGFPAEVSSVTDAYRILMDWPTSRSDIAHKMALNACRGAFSGDVDTETVRSLFTAFADKHKMLAPTFDLIANGSPHQSAVVTDH